MSRHIPGLSLRASGYSWAMLLAALSVGSTWAGVSHAAPVQRPRVGPCPTARFILNAPVVVGPENEGVDVVELASGRVGLRRLNSPAFVVPDCRDARAKFHRTRHGTRLKATWRHCGTLGFAVRMRATLGGECTALRGRLRNGQARRQPFEGPRSVCGDGRTDSGAGEGCDLGSCGPQARCTRDCACEESAACHDTPDALDPGFGEGGKILVRRVGLPRVLAQQPTGMLLVGIAGSRCPIVIRFREDGTQDQTFATGGELSLPFPLDCLDVAMGVGVDGRIALAGWNFFESCLLLARYDADGTPDATFGQAGRVCDPDGPSAGIGAIVGVGVLPGGEILVVGGQHPARYDAQGSRDPSYMTTGGVPTQVDSATAISPDGAVVVASVTVQGLVVSRFLPDGSPDPLFGQGGMVVPLSEARPFEVVALPDGGVVLGSFAEGSSRIQWLDAMGVVRREVDVPGVFALGAQPDGRVLAAGYADDLPCLAVALSRFQPDGSLDTTFGEGGRIISVVGLPIPPISSRSPLPFGVIVQDDGRIIVGANFTCNGEQKLALLRYRAM